jgi:hypothetical protein
MKSILTRLDENKKSLNERGFGDEYDGSKKVNWLRKDFTTKNFTTWERNAKSRGLIVRDTVHPSGGMYKYYTAKDKSGNEYGAYDSKRGEGYLVSK